MHFIVINFFFGGGGGHLLEVGCLKSTFWGWGGRGAHLFEAGRLLPFSTGHLLKVGAYSRLGPNNQIKMVIKINT